MVPCILVSSLVAAANVLKSAIDVSNPCSVPVPTKLVTLSTGSKGEKDAAAQHLVSIVVTVYSMRDIAIQTVIGVVFVTQAHKIRR